MNVTVDYECEDCGVDGVKLWRQYQTFEPDTVCVDCAGARQPDEDISQMGLDGYRPYPDPQMAEHGQTTCSIGWYVPAIPVDGQDAYWGYTSIPDSGIRWWTALPLRAPSDEPLTIEQAIAEYAAVQGWETIHESAQWNAIRTTGTLIAHVPWIVTEAKTINGRRYVRQRPEERAILLDNLDVPWDELRGPISHLAVPLGKISARLEELTRVENLP